MKPARPNPASAALLFALLVGALPAAAANDSGTQAAALRVEARSFEHGEGVARDPARAIELYCAAARLGDIEAQYSLGWIYANARGVPRDDAMAAHFFALAARSGDPLAQRMLRQVGEPSGDPPACLRDPDDEEIDAQGDDDPPPAQREIIGMLRRIAPEYGVHPRLAMAIVRSESNFNHAALSPKNAQGLMQLIPETAERFKVSKPFDPEQNIRGGLSYLRWLLAYFRGDVKLVAAAYNAGEGAVERYRGIPPYPETRDYVQRIRTLFKRDEHPYDPAVTAPSPELQRISARRLL
ncbi:transglycosylase SLT domain-containing protein [Rhodocyclus purpureus]|uniref:transglycosylase SLT domain-containing protein n=1 Tax=Rhodocyclus purpureus TaxID=1067 RepID=UPI001912EA1B|nr:transglycosylase SLT domain-containing protein [Rhodocyclus purpureus]MBK5912964.1 lytic transglycosylase [Rhodocyclus purpureus]